MPDPGAHRYISRYKTSPPIDIQHGPKENLPTAALSQTYLFRVRILTLQRVREYLLVGLIRFVQLRDARVRRRQSLSSWRWGWVGGWMGWPNDDDYDDDNDEDQ